MAEAQDILGQAFPSAGVLEDLYSATAKTVVSSVSMCNQDGSADTLVRLSVAKNAEADARKQYVYYDLPVLAADTFIATVGITLGIGGVVRGLSANGLVSFNLFGVTVT